MAEYFEEDGVLYQGFICNGKLVVREYNQPHTHNLSNTRVYAEWKRMRNRCYQKSAPYYRYYGRKGISVCDEWLEAGNGFLAFYNWAMKNGYDDSLSLDRIDPNGDYEPNNCRWIPIAENRLRAISKKRTPKYIYTGINEDKNLYAVFYKPDDFMNMFNDVDSRRIYDCCNGRFENYKGWRFERHPFNDTEGQETILKWSTREDELPVEVRNLSDVREEDIVHTS